MSSSSKLLDVMTSEYHVKREVAQEAYRAAKEKDQTIQKLEELKFLMIETVGKDPNVAFWIDMEKDKIIKNYNLQPRQ